MGRSFASCPCAINGDLLFFMTFYCELLFWNFSRTFFICFLYWLHLHLLLWRYCEDGFYHWLISLQMDNDRRFPFDWWIISFCHVQFYLPCCYLNLMFRMLVDYWDDLIIVKSWMGIFCILLSISGFLQQVLSVSLKSTDVCTLS